MPRDTNEGDVQILSEKKFKVKTNEPLKFPVHSSATRMDDKLGEFLNDRDEISELPPLITSLQYGKSKQTIEVELSTILNETGTLEVWLNSTSTYHKWQLKSLLNDVASRNVDRKLVDLDTPQLLKS